MADKTNDNDTYTAEDAELNEDELDLSFLEEEEDKNGQ